IYEQLRDRVDAPADVRVEAGYKRGRLFVQRGQPTRAAQAWMNDVIVPSPFIKENAERLSPADKRPYWLARTLVELGTLYETQGKFEEARQAYQLVLQARLDLAEGVAKDALRRLGKREGQQ
ncbi:MAG TPA: tetratricopeptide repeat protein, partial [Opitutaceae bacterium]